MLSYTVFFSGHVPSSIRWSRRQIGAVRAALRVFVIALVAHLAVMGTAVAASVNWGAYDPESRLASVSSQSFDHVFVSWTDIDFSALGKALAASATAGRQFLITVEPVPITGREAKYLLLEVVAGVYDRLLDPLCAFLASSPAPVMVRWGHEMDDDTGRYPWAGQDAATFRYAFAHVAVRCREKAPDIRMVWSIKGLPDATQYYPGNGAVDVVGIATFSLDASDLRAGRQPSSFHEKLDEKVGQVMKLGRPVLVAEAGVAGPTEYRRAWLAQMAQPRMPLVGVIYFNAREPWAWPDDLGFPDWRITTDDLPCSLR